MARNNGGILSAQLKDDRANVVAVCKVAVHLHAHIEGAGEGRAIHFRVFHKRLAQRGAGTGNKVHYAFREAGVAQTFSIEPDDPGGIRCRLDDDRISSHERRAGWSTGQRKGEVEWADDQPDTVRTQDRHIGGVKSDERISCPSV